MRAIMVAVDYSDILSVTLPYNRIHFEDICIVTDGPSSAKVAEIAGSCAIYVTDAFTRNGAVFNKWLALEEGLDRFGRHGVLCIMDADVLWPKSAKMPPLRQGCLYTPRRRMWEDWPALPPLGCTWNSVYGKQDFPLPLEQEWIKFPLHRQQREFAGYTQIFHADDKALSNCGNCGYSKDSHRSGTNACTRFAWHQTNWTHCGGADSFFQARWPESSKIRPPFECLHLGPSGINWLGRSTRYADGSIPQRAEEKTAAIKQIWQVRSQRRGLGLDPFTPEKLD